VSVRRSHLVLAGGLALVFGAAPTVGDVGSCGDTATELDPASFANGRKKMDCVRCTECGLTTQTCRGACDPNAPSTVAWPRTCHPLRHDGEVCLRALRAASCSSYATFVDDVAPNIPTECDFCLLALDSGASTAEP
jgi:hypothetical protein